MIQSGSILKISDTTGVKLVRCIKVLSASNKQIACLGDLILVTVLKIDSKKFAGVKFFKKKKFFKGTLHKSLIIRTKINYVRSRGIYLKFNENSSILVNKKRVSVSNRIKGPILRELCVKIPSLGCVTRFII